MMMEQCKVPAPLQPGDTIGMVCPAGFMDPTRMEDCFRTLERWGLKVKKGRTLESTSDNYFSGTDEERLTDLQEMLDDPSVNAILFGRGGYGTSRILDKLDFTTFLQHPKWIVGFSDITALHCHLQRQFNITSIHGPMAAAFIGEGALSDSVHTLQNALFRKGYDYSVAPNGLNREGEAEGVLIGGNLALLAHLVGTPSDPDYSGKILFIEDIGEYLYSIDRMLLQLQRAGKLQGLAGMIVGGFTDMKDTPRPFGQTITALIQEKLEGYTFPVCYDFPVSHGAHNYALKCGLWHSLEVREQEVRLVTTGQ